MGHSDVAVYEWCLEAFDKINEVNVSVTGNLSHHLIVMSIQSV